jgi:DNA-binding NarL/FixJ family response regulator
VAKVVSTRAGKVCILSSHPLVLAELRALLATGPFRLQARRLDSVPMSVWDSPPVPRAHIYVIDAHAPRSTTELLVGCIRDSYPRARQLVVAEKYNETNAYPLLRLGVKGLLTYAEARQNLARALQIVADGGYWVPRRLLSRFVDSILSAVLNRRMPRGPADLSRREREVLKPLLRNRINKEIANTLNISERTVKFHVSRLLSKFGVRRRSDLILLNFQDRVPGR